MIDLNQTCSSVNMFTWTKEKPTKPGFYWKRDSSTFLPNKPSVVYGREYGGKLCINNWEIPDNAEWSGHICEPIAGSYQSDGLDSNNIFE